MKNGTYVGLRVLEPSVTFINQYCYENGLERGGSQPLHVTLMMSHNDFVCSFKPNKLRIYVVSCLDFAIFPTRTGQGNFLVTHLHAPDLVKRHDEIRKNYGAVSQFSEYLPHLSLSYNYYKGHNEIKKLPRIQAGIVLGDEYVDTVRYNGITVPDTGYF